LAGHAIERGINLPGLKQLRTFGEVLSDETRELCQRAWQVGIADLYSSEEAGSIAVQCEHGAYHLQSENLLVEIIDDHGAACLPGEIGRVLITTLHNFAMPLIRYEIGDYAECGAQ
jgi:phenylacetate-CoA ligase